MPKPSVLFASSEVVGFAKTGGLGDVCGSLPPALAESGHPCAVIMPLYFSAKHGNLPVEPTDVVLRVPFDGSTVQTRLWRGRLPDSDVTVWLVEHADFFERDDEKNPGGFYQRKLGEDRKEDYPDNWARFGFFCRGIDLPAEGLVHISTLPQPDIYDFDRTIQTLTGRRTGTTFRLGDAVRVKVALVDPDRRELDFQFVRRLAKPKPTRESPPSRKKKSGNRQSTNKRTPAAKTAKTKAAAAKS